MIRLIPMDETDFQAYLDEAVEDYAQDKVKAGNWSPAEATERSKNEFLKLLPEGVRSKDQHLFTILDAETGAKVGMIWFAALSQALHPYAFIYDFRISNEFQGKGYGKQAMLAVEDEVKKLGMDTISLHVFGHNQVARALYEKIGYEITNINMSKRLDH